MRYALALAVLLLGALWIAESCDGKRKDAALAAWRERADSALTRSVANEELARERERVADSARAERDALKVERMHLLNRLAARRRDVPSVPAVAPDTCLPWLRKAEALEGVVATQDSAMQGLVQEVQLADQETAALRTANTTLHATVDTLQAVIAAHPKPKNACRLLGIPCPVVGLGVSLGLDGKIQPGLHITVPLRLW